jgi:ankyrin repeat protein
MSSPAPVVPSRGVLRDLMQNAANVRAAITDPAAHVSWAPHTQDRPENTESNSSSRSTLSENVVFLQVLPREPISGGDSLTPLSDSEFVFARCILVFVPSSSGSDAPVVNPRVFSVLRVRSLMVCGESPELAVRAEVDSVVEFGSSGPDYLPGFQQESPILAPGIHSLTVLTDILPEPDCSAEELARIAERAALASQISASAGHPDTGAKNGDGGGVPDPSGGDVGGDESQGSALPEPGPGEIRLRFRAMNGGEWELNVATAHSIRRVKELLCAVHGPSLPEQMRSADAQKLIHLGRVLRDEQSLDAANVNDGSVVHLVANGPLRSRESTPVQPRHASAGHVRSPSAGTGSVHGHGHSHSHGHGHSHSHGHNNGHSPHAGPRVDGGLHHPVQGIAVPVRVQADGSIAVGQPQAVPAVQPPNSNTGPPTPAQFAMRRAVCAGKLDDIRRCAQRAEDAWRGGVFHLACMVGNADVVRCLVEDCGAQVEERNTTELQETGLITACSRGNGDVVRYLVEKAGADVSVRCTQGCTPLLFAVRGSHASVVEFLLNGKDKASGGLGGGLAGADANDRDSNGASALHYAAASGSTGTVAALLQHGARVEERNAANETPLHLAAFQGHPQIIQTLVAAGANVEAVAGNGLTPLHMAIANSKYATLDFLLALGADATARTPRGMDALAFARHRGQAVLAELIARYQAQNAMPEID